MNIEIIIQRCTRDGHVAWAQVARQLGRSVDSVRAQHDPSYMRAHIWAPSREPQPEMVEEVDENDMTSPYPKGIGMKAKILALLERQMMSVETLASFLQSPPNSVRARLDRLLEAGRVYHDSAFPRSWGLTEDDGQNRVYAATALGVSRVAVSLHREVIGRRRSHAGSEWE